MPWQIIPGVEAYEGEEISKMTYNPVKYWLKPFIPKLSKAITSGKAKVGKSTFILQMAFAIVRDEQFFEYETERCKILYIAFEPVSHKVGILLKAMPGPLDGFTVVPMIRRYTYIDEREPKKPESSDKREPTAYEMLDQMIDKKQPNIVVLDPLRYTMRGDVKDDQQCAEWTKRLDTLQEKYKELDLSFVIIGHESKRGHPNPVDRPFGSVILGAWADTITSVTRGRDKYRRMIELVTRHEEEPEPAEFEFHGIYSLAPEKAEKKARAKEALQQLRLTNPEIKPKAMVEQVSLEEDISVPWVWEAHKELKAEEDQAAFGHLF